MKSDKPKDNLCCMTFVCTAGDMLLGQRHYSVKTYRKCVGFTLQRFKDINVQGCKHKDLFFGCASATMKVNRMILEIEALMPFKKVLIVDKEEK